jgi:hypothetical protein
VGFGVGFTEHEKTTEIYEKAFKMKIISEKQLENNCIDSISLHFG